jgi:hypothetical protein
MSDVWYRYEDVSYAHLSFDVNGGESYYSTLRVELRKFDVVRRTPKGVWLAVGFTDKRWVSTTARKRFACPTVEEARESFRARKQRQMKIHEARADRARRALRELDKLTSGAS